MAPNANYATIERPLVVEERKPEAQVSFKLAAAVAVCACALFFAGRANSHPVEFTHQDVLDVEAFCGAGQFIGKCQGCKQCASYEFNNGGCTFFKDTFCTYCEPIANCPRERVTCDHRYNSQCQLCDCNDPITDYTDIEVSRFHDFVEFGRLRGGNVGARTFSCYISDNPNGPDQAGTCKACKVCPKGTYQTKACNPETNEDTQCKPCTKCGEQGDGAEEHWWTQQACTYNSDTVCQQCTFCDLPMFASEACKTGSPYEVGQQAVCSECSASHGNLPKACADGYFVVDGGFCEQGPRQPYKVGSDTKCQACTKCDGNEEPSQDTTTWVQRIDGDLGLCKMGERYVGNGCADDSMEDGVCVNHDTVCTDCEMTDILDCDEEDKNCKYYLETACCTGPECRNHPVVNECTVCGGNTWEKQNCEAFQPSICQSCARNHRIDPHSGKFTSSLIRGCNWEDHRCHIKGDFFTPKMGIHHAMVDAAKRHEGAVGDVDYGQAMEYDHMILSYCAKPDCADGECRCEASSSKFQCDDECNMDACQNGFMGPQCQYAKVYSGCAGDVSSDRAGDYLAERTARKGRKWFDDSDMELDICYPKGEGRSTEKWLAWCMRECEENPFCEAFEIQDGLDPATTCLDGSDRAALLERGKDCETCHDQPDDERCGTAEKSGKWSVKPNTYCRLFRNAQVCPEASDNQGIEGASFIPAYHKDCYVNKKRDKGVLRRINNCPAPVHPVKPACVWNDEKACKKIKDDKCDTYNGESWCPSLKKCVDRSCTPCPGNQDYPLDDVCENPDETYCYCKTACLNKEAGDVCREPWIHGKSLNLSGLTLDEDYDSDCWAVKPLVQQCFGNGDTEDEETLETLRHLGDAGRL